MLPQTIVGKKVTSLIVRLSMLYHAFLGPVIASPRSLSQLLLHSRHSTGPEQIRRSRQEEPSEKRSRS